MVEDIVGCYVLHLYCTNGVHGPRERSEYTGRNEREAVKAARADGWRINVKQGIAECQPCQLEEKGERK